MSHITCHLSQTLTFLATDPFPAHFHTVHSDLVCLAETAYLPKINSKLNVDLKYCTNFLKKKKLLF